MKAATTAVILTALFAALPSRVEAQRLQIHASAAASTGLSLGTGPASTAALRSPTGVSMGVLGSNSEQPWLRYGVSLRAELEGKVTVGIAPQIVLVATWTQLEYGILGALPLIIAPRSLYGLEAGGFAAYRVLDWLAPVVNLRVSFFPLGNDLPDDSVVVMLQADVGVQLQF